MYHFHLAPILGFLESLSLYHQAPDIVQIRESEIHYVLMINIFR